MKHFLLSFALLSAFFLSTQQTVAKVYYVKSGATGDGSSWAQASGSIDQMLEVAQSGDEIWIAIGVYKPVRLIKSSKKNSRAFMLKEGVSLYGGFVGTEQSKAERVAGASGKPYDYANETVLSGDDDTPDQWIREIMAGSTYRYGWRVEKDLIPGTANNSNHVLYAADVFTAPTTIDGLTLKGGNAMVFNVKAAGGALYARGNVHLNACKVVENSAYFTAQSTGSSNTNGGAVYLDGGGKGSITYCYFARNYSHSSYGNGLGGAVYAVRTTITGCDFEDCVGLDGGGALVNIEGTVSNCHFARCYSSAGGAVYNAGVLTDCVIVDCKAINGGGILNTKTVERVTVAGCYADATDFGDENGGSGGGIYNKEGEVNGALVYNNKAFKGGGIFVRGGKITNSTVMHNALRKTNTDADFGFYEGLSEANNVINSISGNVGDANFKSPTAFYGLPTTPEETSVLLLASWQLVDGSPLMGKGYQAGTTAIDAPAQSVSVVATTYYTLDGIAVSPSQPGIYVEVNRLSNGTTRRRKVVLK